MGLGVGDKLGPYEISGRLGAGGMGEVLRARDTRLQREVAIKILPPGVAHDTEALRRLELEARAIAALNHPNLLTIYDVGTLPESGSPYLVSELLVGETLRQQLASGPLGARKTCDYGAQIARGLAAAHARGIVHRDLKPENLFCCEDGRVKVLDFGLAKMLEPEPVLSGAAEERTVLEAGAGAAQGTVAGVVLGTLGYMSPEQARGRPADARSDIFSLGAVMYEMLSGRRAFAGESSADVLSAILKEEPPELASAALAAPAGLERIIRHCLEKQPAQRYQSAGDIAFQLQELSLASSAASGYTATGLAGVGGMGQRKRRLAFALAGTLGLVVVGAGAWFGGRGSAPAPVPRFQALTFQQGIIGPASWLPDGQGFVATARWNQNSRGALISGRLGSAALQNLGPAQGIIQAVAASGDMALIQKPGFDTHGFTVGTLARAPSAGGQARAVMDNIEAADWRSGDLDHNAVVARARGTQTTLEYPVGTVLYRTTGLIDSIRLSPAGNRIAFIEHMVSGDDNGHVAVISAQPGGTKRNLTGDYSSAEGLAWAPGGKEIWFTAGDIGKSLWAVDLGGNRRLLFQGVGDLSLDGITPQGRVLIHSDDRRYMVKVFSSGTASPADVSIRDASIYAQISADGKQVAVGEEADGVNYSTYYGPADGSAPVRLGDGEPMAISPDGKWVASVLPSTPRQLVLEPTGVGQQRALTQGKTDFDFDVGGSFLPDSQSLVASGEAPGQLVRTYWIRLDGAMTAVTPPGVAGGIVSSNGGAVLAQSATKQWALYPLRGGAPTPVTVVKADDAPLRFAANGDLLVAARTPGATEAHAAQIWRVNLRTGARALVTSVALPDATGVVQGNGSISVSADGKTVTVGYERVLSTLCLVSGLR